ncbi:methyltransferase domain-containing protein [Candidatus Pelagibacter sp.]|nr:methyltransferase domain-containing protein [Candidatus Pelagibacter sp.]
MKKRILKLGDNIKGISSNWKFSGSTAKNFDNHIKKSVPLYDWSHDISLKLSDFFLNEKTNVYDLGCSTGTFLKELSIRSKEKKHTFYGIDEVKDMCKIAIKNNQKRRNVKIINKKIEDIKFKKSSLITSFYTMQFIHPSRRQNIFNKIYKNLNWSGAFILFEKVRAPDARFQDITMQIYNDYKIEQGFTSEEIISKSISLKGVMDPFSSNANFEMLKRAGFKDVMSILKFLNFEGFLAIK